MYLCVKYRFLETIIKLLTFLTICDTICCPANRQEHQFRSRKGKTMRNFIAWIRRYGWVLVAAAVTALLLYGYVERVAVGEFLWGFVQWTFNEVAVPTIALAVVVYAVLRICGYHTLWGKKKEK